MRSSTKVQWRVQVRMERYAVWKNAGLFETRDAARERAIDLRGNRNAGDKREPRPGYGFGNTRVVRYEKAGK